MVEQSVERYRVPPLGVNDGADDETHQRAPRSAHAGNRGHDCAGSIVGSEATWSLVDRCSEGRARGSTAHGSERQSSDGVRVTAAADVQPPHVDETDGQAVACLVSTEHDTVAANGGDGSRLRVLAVVGNDETRPRARNDPE